MQTPFGVMQTQQVRGHGQAAAPAKEHRVGGFSLEGWFSMVFLGVITMNRGHNRYHYG